MKLDKMFKTRTMARILASQGQLKKAKAIYHYLLEQNPHHQDLKAELDALDKKQLRPKAGSTTDVNIDLSPLYENWIRTAISYHRRTGR